MLHPESLLGDSLPDSELDPLGIRRDRSALRCICGEVFVPTDVHIVSCSSQNELKNSARSGSCGRPEYTLNKSNLGVSYSN
ncbi:hypothetical protein Ciccas_006850 [Cichlidogyrus casuarinus]|uniref:Recombination activating protein 1 n=1 Tax=Cichlidogyrus casuarinus TaxID=1844966 RepID=A0ABD2Q4J3_9PLAT